MRFIYQYPDTRGRDGDMLDAGPVPEVAVAVERTGWDGFAFTEHPAPGARWLDAGGHQTTDPFVSLGCAAGVTDRILLLTYLAVAPYRNPMLLAKAAATLDQVSGGRLVLGLGAGYQKSEFHALGVDMDERNALFDEVLDVLPLHWSGEPFSYRGRHFTARDVIARPRPVQSPIPVWIGGNSGLTLRRVAERAQGWMPLLGPPELTTTTRTSAVTGLDDLTERITRVRAAAGDRPIEVLVPYLDEGIHRPERDADRHRQAFADLEAAGVTGIAVAGRTGEWAATDDFLAAFGSTYL